MVTVGRRVQEAIDHMGKGELDLALTAACIALDITSQRYAGVKRSSRSTFKKFVKDHLWLITYVGFPRLMGSNVRVPFDHPEVKADAAGTIGLEDIIYHVIRCSLIHSDEKDTRVVWNDSLALGHDSKGNLVLNRSVVWGILAAVITSPLNKDEQILDTYWLTIADFKNFVSNWWGQIDHAARIVKFYTGVDVP